MGKGLNSLSGGQRKNLGLGSLFAIALGMLSCAPPLEEETLTAVCSLPANQTNTLTGRWRTSPIFLSFREGQFNTYEMGLFIEGVEIWNRFYEAMHGMRIFDYGTRSQPRVANRDIPTSLCANSIVNASGEFEKSVTIYKQSAWTYSSGAIAITSNCANDAVPVDRMYIAIMELNYQHFFISGKPVPDMTSIAVHELGHLLGLDHSCATSTVLGAKTQPPLCSSSGLSDDYFSAVMYPVFSFKADATGVARRSLNANDRGRANCLYGTNAI